MDGRLARVVASYVLAHPRAEEIRGQIGDLHDYVRARRLADLPKEELERLALGHRARLDREAQLLRQQARLFAPGGRLRAPRRRHGAAFCGACGMYKDHRKECPHCGNLEFTF